MFIEGGGLGVSEFSARKKNRRLLNVVLVHASNFCIGGRDCSRDPGESRGVSLVFALVI